MSGDGVVYEPVHVSKQSLLQIAPVIPCSNAGFRKDDFFVGQKAVDVIQFACFTSVVMPCRTYHQFASFILICQSIKYPYRVFLLFPHVVIVPIVVKTVDLCCESSFFEGCCKMWNKLSLFVPWHKKAGAVALVEGLVLWSNGMDVNPLLSKCLYKLYEILCICASHIGVEMSACPGVVLLQRPQILYFHPFRACPWRGNDLDIWVDVQDFFDDGDDVVGFIIV